jgi:hypothetical protein
MAIVPINIGAAPDDMTGDTLRAAGIKINNNFTEVGTRLLDLESPARTIIVDADRTVIAGKRYTSYTDAVAWINGNATPNYFEPWIVKIRKSNTENTPVLYPYIYPVGEAPRTGLITEGNWSTSGSNAFESHMMFNLSTGGINPGTGVTVQVWDSTLNDQEATTGTGTIWLKNSNMYDLDSNANLATAGLVMTGDSQATVQNVGNVQIYGESYLTIKGSAIASLQAYNGGTVYFNANATVSGFVYAYGAELYGVNFAALATVLVDLGLETVTGSKLKELISNMPAVAALRTLTIQTASQIMNTIFYNLDVVADNAALETVGCPRGLGTETITSINGGSWTNRGDIFNPEGSQFLTATDMESAIKELETKAADAIIALNGTNARSQVGMKVLRNTAGDAGTWSDITDDVLDGGAGNQAMFVGTAVSNAFYVGADQFPVGIGYNLSTALVLGGGSVDVQYWNGAWTSLRKMETNAKTLLSNANVILEQLGFLHLRHNEPGDSVAVSLDGNLKHWIRIIVTGAAITTSPILEIVNWFRDGIFNTEFFGIFQRMSVLNIYEFQDVVGRLSGNEDVLAGPNTGINKQNNQLANNSYDAFGVIVRAPEDINTAFDMTTFFSYVEDSNAVSQWESRMFICKVQQGDVADGTLSEQTASSIQSTNNSANVVKQITEAFGFDDLVLADELQITLGRDATGGNLNDLFTGDIFGRVISLIYKRWK